MFDIKKHSQFFVSWEMILVYIFILINVLMMVVVPYIYFQQGSVTMIIQSAMIPSMMVFGMLFILLLGDIDVSISSILLLSSMVMGFVYGAVENSFLAIICALVTGVCCGLFNGILVAKLQLPAVIVTIASSMLFRGIARIIMGTNSLSTYPKILSPLAWNSVGGVPISLICFIIGALILAFLLHFGVSGRVLFAMGNNPTAAKYSGVKIETTKILVFAFMGLMCGLCSLFFIGQYSGIDSNAGVGLEMEVIAICALGGVSTAGGKGSVFGIFIATLVYGFLFYMLGFFGVESNTRKIITGTILIITVSIPVFSNWVSSRLKHRVIV